MPAPDMPSPEMNPEMPQTPPMEAPAAGGGMIMIDRSAFEDLKEILSGIMSGIDDILASQTSEKMGEMEGEMEGEAEGEMEGEAEGAAMEDEEFLKSLMAEGSNRAR